MADPQSTVSAPAIIRVRAAIEREGQKRFLLGFLERSARAREPHIDTWNEIWDNYLVVPTGTTSTAQWRGTSLWPAFPGTRYGPERSVLKDPETHQIVESLAAQSLGLLFSTRDYIQATPVGSDDPDKARLISRLLMAILERPGLFRTAYQLFKDAFIFGTSIVELGWETRSRMQYVPTPISDEMGYPLGIQLMPAEVLYRDRPLFRQIDHYDFFPDPSGTRIQEDMIGAAKRFTITPQEARRLAAAGAYDDPAAVERAIVSMKKQPPIAEGMVSPQQRQFDRLIDKLPSKMGLLCGFEYFGEYPDRTADGMSNRKITLLNGELVAGYGNPFMDGAIPYKEIVVNPVQGRFWGLSPAEVVRYLQDSTDHFMMMLQDATNTALRGPLLAGRGFGGDIERIRNAKYGEVIDVTDKDKIGPIPRDTSVLQLSMVELARRKVNMREATGANSPQQPVPLSGRPTATEVSEVTRIASQRGEMMTMLIEKDDYPHIGRTLHLRMRQFTKADTELVGVYAGERFSATLEDIDIDTDVRFIGSRQAASKFQRFAALKEAYAILSTNPEAALMFPDLVVRIFRDGLDIVDADAIVARAQMMIDSRERLANARNQEPPRGQATPGSGSESNFGTRPGETEKQGGEIR